MDFFRKVAEKWNIFWGKVSPVLRRIGSVFAAIGRGISTVWGYIYKLRAIFLAIPVATVAAVQAVMNLDRLPEMVEYTTLRIDKEAADPLFGSVVLSVEHMSRDIAVFGPLALTVVCLLMLLCSKRTLYPWLISLFPLCIPVLLYLFNIYPA